VEERPFLASLTVPSRVQSIRPAAAFLQCAAEALGVPRAKDRIFEVAVVEALNNALNHGTSNADESIVCELELRGSRLIIRVLGTSAIPAAVVMPSAVVPLPDMTAERWEAIPEHGYGLHLMAAVFPNLRPISRGDRHGIEMELNY
jgi:anti-sigma regulatory factor (Ser/Thr protein kinase)